LDSAIRIPCLREAALAKAGEIHNWNGQLIYGCHLKINFVIFEGVTVNSYASSLSPKVANISG
jgi:hypothetical protein